MILSEIKAAVIAFSVGVLIATPTGFYLAGRLAKADRVDALVEARKEDTSEIVKVLKSESVLQAEIRTARRAIEKTRNEAKKYEIPAPTQAQDAKSDTADCRAAALGDDLVRLLNDARASATADANAGGDAEGGAVAEPRSEGDRR